MSDIQRYITQEGWTDTATWLIILREDFDTNSQERLDLITDKPWSEDNSLLPPKWVTSRLKSGKKSIEFIEEFQPSSSTTYYSVFSIFQGIALIPAVLIIIFPFI
jgi:hypothetical protein